MKEVLQSEKKLKVKSLLNLNSSTKGTITIRDYLINFSDEKKQRCDINFDDSFLMIHSNDSRLQVPTTPACTWWNRPEEDNSSGKLESTHPSRTSVKSDQGFFGVESVMRVNADSLLIRAAATSTSGTLNDLTTDLIMANNNMIHFHTTIFLSRIILMIYLHYY